MRNWVLLCSAAALSLPAAAKPKEITFYKDVLPVLQSNCQACHRPGEPGPMPLLTYKQARPWAKAIRDAVASKKMPPWFADPQHGKFVNDRRLAETDIDTLTAWANGGAKEGSPKDAPKPVEFVEGWKIGKPDLILEMPSEFTIPASGTIEYQHFIVPTGFTEDRWVQAVEVRAGNRTLVHHAVGFIRPPNSKWLPEAKVGEAHVPRNWMASLGIYEEVLDTYVPGATPHKIEPGQAKLIPAGSDIVLQMHYTANGKGGIDRSRVGIIFAKEPPTERIYTMQVTNGRFVIPPGVADFPVAGRFTFQHDVKLVGMSPHMHLRGKSMVYKVTAPGSEPETLLNVPNYDFNWQLTYYLANPMALPKGTRIDVAATFDNSPNNPRNPDPTKEVRWGDQSWQEMMVGFMEVAIDARLDPMELYRARRPATGAE